MTNFVKRIIGLTGGIATGKTTVSRYLAEKHQLPILDADIYAREAVALDSPILTEIVDRYGTMIQLSDGHLNRKVLAEIIFNNPEEKQWLEAKIHPFVRAKFLQNLRLLNLDTIVLAIPLLFEAKMTDLVSEIWVVSCTHEQQIKRLQARDNLTEEQAITRLNNQLPLEQKIAAADLVLDNSNSLENLYKKIDQAMENN
jgi:dephospho-CoA kinase